MKKIILFAAVLSAFSFASCKKDRICSCTTTNSDGSAGSTEDVTLIKSTSGNAKKECINRTQTNGTNIATTTCTLK